LVLNSFQCQAFQYLHPNAALLLLPFFFSKSRSEFFNIYFIAILQKIYIVHHKFCNNIHLPPWLTASGT
jgi:hypothetical protein